MSAAPVTQDHINSINATHGNTTHSIIIYREGLDWIGFNTVHSSLSTGKDFTMHSLGKDCWWIEWLFSTKSLGPSLVSREISWASGMDFPIPPSFWWSIVCVFTKVGVATLQLVFISPPNDHFLPNRNKIATQSLVKIWTSYWSISQLHHWGICPSLKLWLTFDVYR